MKKRFLLPCLLMVGSLSACGGNSGLVKNGVAYREGDAAKVDAALKAQKENSVATCTVNETADIGIKMSAEGQTVNMSESVKAKMTADLVNKSIEGTFDMNINSNGQTQKVSMSFDGREVGGQLVVNTYGQYASVLTEDNIETYYMQASYAIYSWNYSLDASGELATLMEQMDAVSSASIASFLQNLYSNMVIAGDPATGTFDVGLSKPVSLYISGLDLSYNKMKYSYKDCLLQSAVVGIKGSGNLSGYSVSINESVEANYSYTYRK